MTTSFASTRNGSTDERLLAVLDDWQRAIVANDAARIATFMSDDWVMVSENGVTTAQRFLGFVESGALTHSAMDRVGEPRIRYHGEVALLTTRATNTARFGGERFDADEWTTDVFVASDGRWKCVLTHITAAAPG